MSYGYYRLGSSVDPAGARDRLIAELLNGAAIVPTEPVVAPAVESPRLADTLLDGEPGAPAPAPRLSAHAARRQGYTGNTCMTCGSARMKVSGHCEVCEDCGSTTGCS
jgi:hypothetical protein